MTVSSSFDCVTSDVEFPQIERGHRQTVAVRARRVLLFLFFAALLCTGSVVFAASTWPVYHGTADRAGNDTSEPALNPLHTAWTAPLDGKVYGQPVVYAGRVFAATENDTVYALDAHDGRVLWSRHLGRAMTNVGAQVGCGNIDPLGITSTPVIDTSTGTVFVVATIQDATNVIHHQLVGLGALDGGPRVSVNADPGGGQNPLNIQQRAGLALGNGRVYIGFGGYSGDCGPYHGWLVSITETGTGKVAFNVTPGTREGAVWAPGGPAIDGSGDVYIATGNGGGNPDPDPAHGQFGESVLKFDATLHRLANFSSSNATEDFDLGSLNPALVGGNMVFQLGKQNEGYLLDANTLSVLDHHHVCDGEAKGATAFDGTHVFVPCDEGERIRGVRIDFAHKTFTVDFAGPHESHAGPPIIAGGLLWSVDYADGTLYGINPSSGATVMTVGVGAVPHFASPSAALGLLLIGTNAGVTALAGPSGAPATAPSPCTAQPNHNGYTVAATNGSVFAFGGAPYCGGLDGRVIARPIVGIAGTSGPGYWLVASDGGIFRFGDEHFYGSMGGRALNRPIVGMAATPSGHGYWLVASDGGIFRFGDAHFYGSMGGRALNRPIVGMAATPSGHGYWLVASDGGIFRFGDAQFRGSMGGRALNRPIVGMAATPSGHGYWLVASDGGIFRFGDANFYGSTGGARLVSPITGMVATSTGHGYWLIAGDGGVFRFGDAVFHGSAAGLASGTRVVSGSHD
jgi:outer membrane protein assembly factor BamB/ribosomal protein L24E